MFVPACLRFFDRYETGKAENATRRPLGLLFGNVKHNLSVSCSRKGLLRIMENIVSLFCYLIDRSGSIISRLEMMDGHDFGVGRKEAYRRASVMFVMTIIIDHFLDCFSFSVGA